MSARLRDPEIDGLLPDGLPESVVAVDDREHLGLAFDLDAPARKNLADLHPLHVAAGAEHAMGIVSAEIRAGESPRDAAGLLGIAAGAFEDRTDEAFHRRGIDVNLTVRAADGGIRVAAHPRASATALAQAAL